MIKKNLNMFTKLMKVVVKLIMLVIILNKEEVSDNSNYDNSNVISYT